MKTLARLVVSAAAFACGTNLFATIVLVPGTANIFGAGHSGAAATPGGGDVAPSISFAAAANQVVTFSSVTGSVYINYGNAGDPDGNNFGSSFDIHVGNGISDYVGQQYACLMGVFLSDSEPVDPAPAALDFSYSALGLGFSTLAPEIGQLFFIGDGLTGDGTGDVQQFEIPADATRLFLGIPDTFYGDNTGSFTATVSIVPEPSVATISAAGAFALALMRRRKTA